VVGHLIIELADSDASADQDSRQVQKQISRLYELLTERMLDMSSYVRTKVLSVFSRLCDIKKAKFPKQRLAVTRAAISALEDKAATVRKNAVAVLSKLLVTHPYGLIHGGTLELSLFESQYKAIKEQLDKLEGTIGNAVDRQQGEDDDDDEQGNGGDDAEKSADEEEDQEDEMSGGHPKRKGKKGKKRLIYALSSFASADPTTHLQIKEAGR
jgi:condensin complex subunit 1